MKLNKLDKAILMATLKQLQDYGDDITSTNVVSIITGTYEELAKEFKPKDEEAETLLMNYTVKGVIRVLEIAED